MNKISPSLICLDMCNLESQVKQLEANGLDNIHIDILDGHFSPSMPLGLDTVRQLRKKTNLYFDCHLMVENPDFFINELIDLGANRICFHVETVNHIDGTLNKIHEAGIEAGVALKPSTPLNVLEYVIEKCDIVLLMLINPGYASSQIEEQVPYAKRKIKDLRKMIDKRKLKTKIIIDGRISPNDIKYYKGIVDYFVCGSTCKNKLPELKGI